MTATAPMFLRRRSCGIGCMLVLVVAILGVLRVALAFEPPSSPSPSPSASISPAIPVAGAMSARLRPAVSPLERAVRHVARAASCDTGGCGFERRRSVLAASGPHGGRRLRLEAEAGGPSRSWADDVQAPRIVLTDPSWGESSFLARVIPLDVAF